MDDLSVNANRLTCLSQYLLKHMLHDPRIDRSTKDDCTEPIFSLALTIASSHSFRRSMAAGGSRSPNCAVRQRSSEKEQK